MTNETAVEIANLSPADAKAKVDGGAALVDVRIPAEFAERHAAGAINMPGNSASHRASELGGKEAVFIGAEDGRTKAAAAAAARAGAKALAIVEGGITAWAEAGLPVEQGSPPAKTVGSVDAAQAKSMLEMETAAIVDTRMPYDWAGERIKGSVNLPNISIKARRGEVPEDREVIFIHWDDAKSQAAAEAALGLGFKTVYVLKGGMQAWLDAGYETETISG